MTDYNTPAPLRKRNHPTDSTSSSKKSKSNVENPLAHKSHDSKVMHAHYAEDSMIPTQIYMTNDGEIACERSVTQKEDGSQQSNCQDNNKTNPNDNSIKSNSASNGYYLVTAMSNEIDSKDRMI